MNIWKYQVALFAGRYTMSPNLGISLVDPRPWLKCHFLFTLFFISHIYLMNHSNISHMNDNRFLVIWRNHHRWETQVTWRSVEKPNILLSPFYTFSEQQPKAIEDKACLHQSWSLCTERWKVQKYVLLLEYLKLIVNCSCVQKKNTKQKEIIHLVEPRTLQNKAAETIFWILESKNVSIASIGNSVFDESTMSSVNIYFTFCRNIKVLKHTSFSTWFDSSRIQICCVKIIIATKNDWSFASSLLVT